MVSLAVRRSGMDAMTFESAEEFLESKAYTRPGVLVLDITMNGMCGLELQSRLLTEAPTLPVIMLSATDDVELAVRAMRHRAADFIRKPFDVDALVRSIQAAVVQNQALLMVDRERRTAQAMYSRLTTIEQDLLLLLSDGQNESQVRGALGVESDFYERTMSDLLQKMGVESTVELVQLSHLIAATRDEEHIAA